MKNQIISGQFSEFIASMVRNPEAFERLPNTLRQELVEKPIETMGRLVAPLQGPIIWTTDENGSVRFTVQSNGLTRKQWFERLTCRGWRLSDDFIHKLPRDHSAEHLTIGKRYNIVLRQATKKEINIAGDSTIGDLIVSGFEKNLKTINWEAFCLIADTITLDDLGKMGFVRRELDAAVHQPGCWPAIRYSLGSSIGHNGRVNDIDAGIYESSAPRWHGNAIAFMEEMAES